MLRIQLMMLAVLRSVLTLYELSYRKLMLCGVIHTVQGVFSQQMSWLADNAFRHGGNYREAQHQCATAACFSNAYTNSHAAIYALFGSTTGMLHSRQINQYR